MVETHFSLLCKFRCQTCVFFFFPLHSSTLLQTPSWIPLFSLSVFKIKWCSAQACLLGGSDIPLHAVTSDLGNRAQQIRVYLDPLISFSFPACKTFLVARVFAPNHPFLGMPLPLCSHGRSGSGAKLRFFLFLFFVFLQLRCFPNLPFLTSLRLLFRAFFLA